MTLDAVALGRLRLKETDGILKNMIEAVENNTELQSELKTSEHWKTRWMKLETFIVDNLDRFDLDLSQYQELWIGERFFYEMQQRTGLDYGFCPHFMPAFRNRTESILTGNLDLDMFNKCNYGERIVETTCSGTDRDTCVILNPEMKKLKGNPQDYN